MGLKIRDRIKAFKKVKASQLLPNPKNWRTHGKDQSDALKALLDEVGFAGAVIARETSKGLMLIDGHLRQELAGDDEVPVLILDVNEAEADKILATFDPIGAMAGTDREMLDSLLKDLQTDSEALADMLTSLSDVDKVKEFTDRNGAGDADEDERDPDTGELKQYGEEDFVAEEDLPPPVAAPGNNAASQIANATVIGEDLPEDVREALDPVFGSSNKFGIPDLLLDMQAETLEQPFEIWGDKGRTRYMPGTMSFYTDDSKFTTIYDKPDDLLLCKCYAVVEVNYSVVEDSPAAWAIWCAFRKKWLARYWQSRGVKIFVDLCVPYKYLDLFLMGVPKGWSAFAFRGFTNSTTDQDNLIVEKVKEHCGVTNLNAFVYGGGKKCQDFAERHGFPYVADRRARMPDMVWNPNE